MPGESTLTDVARARSSTPIEFDVGALENGGEQANQPGPRRRVHHRDVELTVGVVGVGTDQHAAAVAFGVAECGQCQVGDDRPRRRRTPAGTAAAATGQLGDHREVVAHPAVRPAHAIGAVADQRVETGGHHGAEPLLRAGSGCRCGPGRRSPSSRRRPHRRRPRDRLLGSPNSRAWSLPVPAGMMPSGMSPSANDCSASEMTPSPPHTTSASVPRASASSSSRRA